MNDIGKELAHWYYEPYEWEYFVWGEWRRVKEGLQKQNRIVIGALSAFLLFVGVFFIFTSGWVGALIGVLWLGLPSLGFVTLIYKLTYESKRRWFKQVHRAAPEVIITTEAVIFGGPDYTSTGLIKNVRGFLTSTKVVVEGNDFGFLSFDVNPGYFQRYQEIVNVLIPNGKEDEAHQVVEDFRRK